MMKLFVYPVKHDTNFAPHIDGDHKYMTLATCKPRIRLRAKERDWVMGVSGKTMKDCDSGRVIYLMKITRHPIDYNSYWNDTELKGRDDNIYHFENGNWIQADHAPPDHDMENDLSGKFVLLSDCYYFFGVNCPCLMDLGFPEFISAWRDYKSNFDDGRVRDFIKTFRAAYRPGVNGEHFHPSSPSKCHSRRAC